MRATSWRSLSSRGSPVPTVGPRPPLRARDGRCDDGVPGRRRRVNYPVARNVDVVDDYHGTQVADPYRWLEDSIEPRVPGLDRRGEHAHRALPLHHPGPRRPPDRLTALWDYERFGVPVREGQRVFFERNSGLQNQSVLYVIDAPRFEPRELLDPNTLSKDGTVALSGRSPRATERCSPTGWRWPAATGRSGASGT